MGIEPRVYPYHGQELLLADFNRQGKGLFHQEFGQGVQEIHQWQDTSYHWL